MRLSTLIVHFPTASSSLLVSFVLSQNDAHQLDIILLAASTSPPSPQNFASVFYTFRNNMLSNELTLEFSVNVRLLSRSEV